MKTTIFMCLILFFTQVIATPSLPGGEVGNGGGAWVCRESNGSIRWMRVIDLFEAESEFGLQLARYPGDFRSITYQLMARAKIIDLGLYGAIEDFIAQYGYLDSTLHKVQYTQDTLEVIADALYTVKPSINKCVGGLLSHDVKSGMSMIPYEQVINFKHDGTILIQSDLFHSERLDSTERSALLIHEAIYAYRRKLGDKNSRITRKIVGLLFSTLSVDAVKKALGEHINPPTPFATMKFVEIQPGQFRMRINQNQTTSVTISKRFEIQTTTVTQLDWYQVMGEVRRSDKSSIHICPNSYRKTNIGSICQNYPVMSVTWDEVQSFIRALNEQDKVYFYRLPTEAEWEYAAHAGGASDFPFGSQWNADEYMWTRDDFKGGHAFLQPVAQLKPNPWGLYDMYGNVKQLVSNWFAEVPMGGVDPVGPISGIYRTVRGCAVTAYGANDCSYKIRDDYLPSAGYEYFVGFRLVRERR